MPKNKQQKKKDRERRVAQKKHEAAQKQAQEKSASEGPKAPPRTNIFTSAVPKVNQVTTNAKKPFNYRRTGG